MVRINAKERDEKEKQVRRAKREKGSKGRRGKPPTPTRARDALIGDEEHNGKQKKQGDGPQPSYPGPFGHLLRPVWMKEVKMGMGRRRLRFMEEGGRMEIT